MNNYIYFDEDPEDDADPRQIREEEIGDAKFDLDR